MSVNIYENGKLNKIAGNASGGGTADLKPNTATDDGYVTKGQDHPNQVWSTDDEGNPEWRDVIFGDVTKFIVDQDSGKITGYQTKAGADAVFPFSTGSLSQENFVFIGRLFHYNNGVIENAIVGKIYLIAYYSSFNSGDGSFLYSKGAENLGEAITISEYSYGGARQIVSLLILRATDSTIEFGFDTNGYSASVVYMID